MGFGAEIEGLTLAPLKRSALGGQQFRASVLRSSPHKVLALDSSCWRKASLSPVSTGRCRARQFSLWTHVRVRYNIHGTTRRCVSCYAKFSTDTVDAIVGATINQLKSYTELVQGLSEGVGAFKAKAVTGESISQYLRDAFPGANGETVVTEGGSYDLAQFEQIVNRLGPVQGLQNPGDGVANFTAESVKAVEAAVRVTLDRAAESSFEQLRIMVQMGYARVIFTNGRIRSKLTFDVETNDHRSRASSDLAQSSFQSSKGLRGGIFGTLLGVSGSTSQRSLRVRTVSQRSMEADKIKSEILGEVEVNFATETFPSVEVAPASPPVIDNPQ